jgi:hypothetical protein
VQGPDHPRQWTGHLLVFSEYSRIELWMNPDANGQLQLLQLIDWFGREPALVDRSFVAHVERPPRETRSYAHRSRPPRTSTEPLLSFKRWFGVGGQCLDRTLISQQPARIARSV